MRIVSTIDPQGTKTHNFHRQSIELGISNLNWNRPIHRRPDPQNCKETANLMWLSLISMVYFIFVCLLKLILYNSKPQNQICDWNQKKMSVLLFTNLRSSFLHDSHNWLWVFFTLLVALAHRATLLALFKLLFYVQTSMSNFFQLKINRKVLS